MNLEEQLNIIRDQFFMLSHPKIAFLQFHIHLNLSSKNHCNFYLPRNIYYHHQIDHSPQVMTTLFLNRHALPGTTIPTRWIVVVCMRASGPHQYH